MGVTKKINNVKIKAGLNRAFVRTKLIPLWDKTFLVRKEIIYWVFWRSLIRLVSRNDLSVSVRVVRILS